MMTLRRILVIVIMLLRITTAMATALTTLTKTAYVMRKKLRDAQTAQHAITAVMPPMTMNRALMQLMDSTVQVIASWILMVMEHAIRTK